MEAIIYNVIMGLVALIAIFFSYYNYIMAQAIKAAEDAVGDVEKDGSSGSEKLEEATQQVYDMIPPVIKAFLSKDAVRKLVQSVFSRIEKYAETQVEKSCKK